jgi:hypothetical protein
MQLRTLTGLGPPGIEQCFLGGSNIGTCRIGENKIGEMRAGAAAFKFVPHQTEPAERAAGILVAQGHQDRDARRDGGIGRGTVGIGRNGLPRVDRSVQQPETQQGVPEPEDRPRRRNAERREQQHVERCPSSN